MCRLDRVVTHDCDRKLVSISKNILETRYDFSLSFSRTFVQLVQCSFSAGSILKPINFSMNHQHYIWAPGNSKKCISLTDGDCGNRPFFPLETLLAGRIFKKNPSGCELWPNYTFQRSKKQRGEKWGWAPACLGEREVFSFFGIGMPVISNFSLGTDLVTFTWFEFYRLQSLKIHLQCFYFLLPEKVNELS